MVDVLITTVSDSLILDTRSKSNRLELSSSKFNKKSSVFKLITETAAGDSVFMKLRADSFYLSLGGNVPISIKPKVMLNVKVYMLDGLDSFKYDAFKQAFEIKAMEKFVKKFRWNATQDSTTGIWYEELKSNKEGKGIVKKSKIKYLIKGLDESLIANSKENEPLTYDVNDKRILLGIQWLSKELYEGESVRAILPSSMAFGPRGNSKVSPYMPVIVELECLEVIN